MSNVHHEQLVTARQVVLLALLVLLLLVLLLPLPASHAGPAQASFVDLVHHQALHHPLDLQEVMVALDWRITKHSNVDLVFFQQS